MNTSHVSLGLNWPFRSQREEAIVFSYLDSQGYIVPTLLGPQQCPLSMSFSGWENDMTMCDTDLNMNIYHTLGKS